MPSAIPVNAAIWRVAPGVALMPVALALAVLAALALSLNLSRLKEGFSWVQHTNEVSDPERQVLDAVVAGHRSEIVAEQLGIGKRGVEIHRANIMTKLQAESLSELVRMVLCRHLVVASCERTKIEFRVA